MKLQTLFITLLLAMTSCNAFRPQSKEQLQAAVHKCVEMSAIKDCSEGPHGSIGDWDVSAVTDMEQIFAYTSAFNQDLSKWDVSAVTNMRAMFYFASAFNQDLSKWDVSAVSDMWGMFSGASTFNQDVSKWDVSAVTNMKYMFQDASSFNQDLSKWDVSAVTDMSYMFDGAAAFGYKLCRVAWVKSKARKKDMFKDSPGSISSRCKRAFKPSS